MGIQTQLFSRLRPAQRGFRNRRHDAVGNDRDLFRRQAEILDQFTLHLAGMRDDVVHNPIQKPE